MELIEIEKKPNLKIIDSTESVCYISDDTIYKLFKSTENIEQKIQIINLLISNKIEGIPIIYDLIYHKDKIVGYSMKYYKNVKQLSEIKNFKLLKQKCIELIELYESIKKEYGICYYDFHKNNVFIYNGKILLLDMDNCLRQTNETEKISLQLLKEYITSLLYKINYFEYETYYTYPEQTYIRNMLFQNANKENQNENDLKNYVNKITKKETKKTLKKIPYKIK